MLSIIYFESLVQNCSNSSELAMELPQSCMKLSISSFYSRQHVFNFLYTFFIYPLKLLIFT